MKDFKIPKRLVVGYRKVGERTYAYPTEIRMSSRTKNSAFKIEKEQSWKNKINDKLPKIQVKNEFRDGFEIKHFNIERYSASRDRAAFYLWSPDYKGYLFIQPDNLLELIQGCCIMNGHIEEKLIYDGRDFITEKMAKERARLSEDAAVDLTALKEEAKSRRVLSRLLVPGQIYEVPISKKEPVPKQWLVYFGKVKAADGQEYFVTRKMYKGPNVLGIFKEGTMTERKIYTSTSTFRNNSSYDSITIPGSGNGSLFNISSANDGPSYPRLTQSQTSRVYKTKYKGHEFTTNTYSATQYTKTLPGQYIPKDDVVVNGKKLKDTNIYNGYTEEDLDLFEFLLMNPYDRRYRDIEGVSTDAVTAARLALIETEQTVINIKEKDTYEPNE